MGTSKFVAANRANWDDRVPIHVESADYDLPGFIADTKLIRPVVKFARQEMGDVRGKSLLHLQCHIGTDTLSWARLGAHVTGLDFSPKAIATAKKLSRDAKTPGRFVVSDVYEAPRALGKRYDVVYTGVGALCWLPDIRKWADVVARCLKPGGVFYVHDAHPIVLAASDNLGPEGPRFANPYFEVPKAVMYDDSKTYAGDGVLKHTRTYEWNHSLGELVTALIDAGLTIEWLREHRELSWARWPTMLEKKSGWWVLPKGAADVPLMFSLKATKAKRRR